jgi:hypothetical protein
MRSTHGIVNGHWEPSERHSRLLELVRGALTKLTKNTEPQATHGPEPEADSEPKSGKRAVAAE